MSWSKGDQTHVNGTGPDLLGTRKHPVPFVTGERSARRGKELTMHILMPWLPSWLHSGQAVSVQVSKQLGETALVCTEPARMPRFRMSSSWDQYKDVDFYPLQCTSSHMLLIKGIRCPSYIKMHTHTLF